MGDRAVVLLSGGLDSATVLAIARAEGYRCYALSVDYGQRHGSELAAAQRVARESGVEEHRRLQLDLRGIGGSALTDSAIEIPTRPSEGIPVTYVPARNTLLLSLALAWAEVLEAWEIFIGANAVDYSGYPDCRPGFIRSFEQTANLATRAPPPPRGRFRIRAPLLKLSKAEIIRKGMGLGVDYSRTVSCYAADEQGHACGVCDSCRLRAQGFQEAGVPDPTLYRC